MIYTTPNPSFHIVVERQPSGVGHDLWCGAVRDNSTGQVVQVRTPMGGAGLYGAAKSLTTIPAYRFGTTEPGGLEHLLETLRGLTPMAQVAA